MLKDANKQTASNSKKIKHKQEILYSRDVNIQDTLEDAPYLQEPLMVEDEVTLVFQLLSSWKATGVSETFTEIWQAIEEEPVKFLLSYANKSGK